jgi:Ser/Thr protein kinase RdoA (MazF antagonist)
VGELIIVVFEWARGSAINFMDFKWIKDKSLIFSWGRYFAQLHKISKKF